MDCYERLNDLIRQDKSVEEITDFIKDNDISGEAYDTLQRCGKADCRCPVVQAVMSGRWDVCTALFAVGFDPHAPHAVRYRWRVWDKRLTIHLASMYKRLSILKSLVDDYHVHVDAEDSEHYTALHFAARSNDFEIVKYLVEAGADIEKENTEGHKPIHEAGNSLKICEYLLSKGAKVVDEANPTGSSLTHVASTANDSCLFLLLQNAKGLNPHEVFSERETLLHICARRGLIESVKLLCTLGWNVDAQDIHGYTPLHCVVSWSDEEMSEMTFSVVYHLVISQNASMYLKNDDQQNPFDMAMALKNIPLLQFFHSAGFAIEPHVLQEVLRKNESHFEIPSLDYVYEILSCPRTLQDLCCFRIRRILGLRLPTAVDSLLLPSKLKDFVRLKHVHKPEEIIKILS